MYAFIDLLNKVFTLILSIVKKQKEEKLQDEYSEITNDVEGYITAIGDNDSGVYKPNGKAPTIDDLRAGSKPK